MDSKNFLVNFVKERIFTNNSRLVTASKVQETLLRVVDNIYDKQYYSAEERLTDAVWLDGQPIYRRTISLNLVFDGERVSSAVFQLSQPLGNYFCIESAQVAFVDVSSALPTDQKPRRYAGLGSKFLNVYSSFSILSLESNPNRLDYVHIDVEEPYEILSAVVVIAYSKPLGSY